MTNQLSAARQFMAGHARLLDRRRFELLFAGGDPERVLAALRVRTAIPTAATGTASNQTCAHLRASPPRRCTPSKSSPRSPP